MAPLTEADRAAVTATTALCAAAALFVVLTVAAMALYPGGSYRDPRSAGYRFFGNFFSDLGQTRVMYGHLGTPNTTSMVLFVVAMVLVSVTLAWAAWPIGRMVSGLGDRAGAVLIGSTGTAAAIGFLGVALDPWDLRFPLHMGFVKFAFGSLLVFMVAVAFEQIRNRWPWRDVAVGAIYALALAGYFLNLLYGPKLNTPNGVMIQSVLQKLIVYTSILCLTLIAWAVRARALAGERVSS